MLGIKDRGQIVVQIMEEPEDLLDDKSIVLLFCLRDCQTKTYSEKVERKLTILHEEKFATIKHL